MQHTLACTQEFWAASHMLPKDTRKKLRSLLKDFPEHPDRPGYNFEKIKGSADTGLRSIRVDQTYRVIAKQEPGTRTLFLLHVDHHDAAYAWAGRHRLALNDHTGVVQLVNVQTVQVPHAPEYDATHRCLFDGFRDRQLRRIGVPDELLPLVRGFASHTDLGDHEDELPPDTWIALSELARGASYDDIVREIDELKPDISSRTLEEALDHPGSHRQFIVLEDDDSLKQMLDAPLGEWRIYLHPTQQRIVDMHARGPMRVLGGAGTGKTVVAMHRTKRLAEEVFTGPDDRILFLVFNKNLAQDIKGNLSRICSPLALRRIEVINVDAWALAHARSRGMNARYAFDSDSWVKECWRIALDELEGRNEWSEYFIKDEFSAVVLARGLKKEAEYLHVSRRGRGRRLSRAQRARLWRVFEAYRNQLANHRLREPADVYGDLQQAFTQSPPGYNSVVVDEAQDMSAAAMRMIRAIVPEGDNDILIAGDAHQRIYGRKTVMSRCGIQIRGRSRRLKINYRTPEQLRHWAVGLLEGVPFDDLDDSVDTVRGYRSLFSGIEPTIARFEDQWAEVDGIVEHIRSLESEVDMHRICVVASTRADATFYEGAIGSRRIKVYALPKDRSDDLSRPGVRVATMFRVKGLEYDHMLVVRVNRSTFPPASLLRKADDPVSKAEIEQRARSLLYVACTRARKTLWVSSFGRPSHFLP